MLNGSFGIPSTASDGIQEMDVTDDSIRIVGPFRDLPGRFEPMPLPGRLQELSRARSGLDACQRSRAADEACVVTALIRTFELVLVDRVDASKQS
jgi:hypothetical protein